jgi:hypothetical protein
MKYVLNLVISLIKSVLETARRPVSKYPKFVSSRSVSCYGEVLGDDSAGHFEEPHCETSSG